MNIRIKNIDSSELKGTIIPIFENKISKLSGDDDILKSIPFEGKADEVFYTTYLDKGLKYRIYVGLGKEEQLNGEVLRNAIARGIKQTKALKLNSFAIEVFESNKICLPGIIKCITEASAMTLYSFDKYKSQKSNYNPKIYITNVDEGKLVKANKVLNETLNIVSSINMAKDLVNEPANVIYPEILANEVVKIGAESGFEVEVIHEEKCRDMGMQAFLSVAKGSVHSPKLIVMRYMGDEGNKEVLGLVGKGLTYDSGGFSLKPPTGMIDMKEDMAGAAAVIGTMSAIAKNKLKKNVVAVVAACENILSRDAFKPGDIIGSMAGKTIEVNNTDAEGRLTLIDAITYIIEKEGAGMIIDVATLTGAAIHALGRYTTAVVSNNDQFYETFMEATNVTDESFWRLPTFDHYKKQLKSKVADLKNSDKTGAGTITAAMFIKEFVQDKPWIHLDIAGTASTESPISEYMGCGATAVPLRTLYYFIKGMRKDHIDN